MNPIKKITLAATAIASLAASTSSASAQGYYTSTYVQTYSETIYVPPPVVRQTCHYESVYTNFGWQTHQVCYPRR